MSPDQFKQNRSEYTAAYENLAKAEGNLETARTEALDITTEENEIKELLTIEAEALKKAKETFEAIEQKGKELALKVNTEPGLMVTFYDEDLKFINRQLEEVEKMREELQARKAATQKERDTWDRASGNVPKVLKDQVDYLTKKMTGADKEHYLNRAAFLYTKQLEQTPNQEELDEVISEIVEALQREIQSPKARAKADWTGFYERKR